MSGEQVGPKPATWGEALGGFIALALLFAIGSCVFGGSDEKSAQAASEPVASPEPQATAIANPPSASTSEPDAEQVSEAEEAVTYIIGLNGYRCINVVDVQDASSGVYDVTCVTDQQGHRALYMVNARTNDVAKL